MEAEKREKRRKKLNTKLWISFNELNWLKKFWNTFVLRIYFCFFFYLMRIVWKSIFLLFIHFPPIFFLTFLHTYIQDILCNVGLNEKFYNYGIANISSAKFISQIFLLFSPLLNLLILKNTDNFKCCRQWNSKVENCFGYKESVKLLFYSLYFNVNSIRCS